MNHSSGCALCVIGFNLTDQNNKKEEKETGLTKNSRRKNGERDKKKKEKANDRKR